jgi:hypothetical protein
MFHLEDQESGECRNGGVQVPRKTLMGWHSHWSFQGIFELRSCLRGTLNQAFACKVRVTSSSKLKRA